MNSNNYKQIIAHITSRAALDIDAAKEAIERGDDICYDVATNAGQIFDNVKHMKWFVEAVAEELGLFPAEGSISCRTLTGSKNVIASNRVNQLRKFYIKMETENFVPEIKDANFFTGSRS